MSKTKNRHPFRKLLLVSGLIVGAVVFRNAVADKGGSYDPAERGL